MCWWQKQGVGSWGIMDAGGGGGGGGGIVYGLLAWRQLLRVYAANTERLLGLRIFVG